MTVVFISKSVRVFLLTSFKILVKKRWYKIGEVRANYKKSTIDTAPLVLTKITVTILYTKVVPREIYFVLNVLFY